MGKLVANIYLKIVQRDILYRGRDVEGILDVSCSQSLVYQR